MIQQMLAIWSLVPLPLLNPVWTSGSSRFMYHWSLTWRMLSITLLVCEMSALCGSLIIVLYCLCLGLEWKLTFYSPVTTAMFSKFAYILSTALEQHEFKLHRPTYNKTFFSVNTYNTTSTLCLVSLLTVGTEGRLWDLSFFGFWFPW